MFRPRRPSTSRSSAPSTSATFSARSSTVSYPPSLPSLCGAHHLWVGLELFTFFAAVYCIWGRSSDYRKGRVFYVAYGGVLLMLVTIAVVTDGLWGQYMWIDRRNYPGGPLGFFAATGNAWYNVFGSAADATANVLGDGLLVRLIYVSCENWKREF